MGGLWVWKDEAGLSLDVYQMMRCVGIVRSLPGSIFGFWRFCDSWNTCESRTTVGSTIQREM